MASSLQVLETKLLGANRLKNVNRRGGNLLPYAVLWINPSCKCSSLADPVGGSSPLWNQTLRHLLPPGTAVEDAVLHVQLLHAASEGGIDPLIGWGQLRLRGVLETSIGGGRVNRRTLQLRRPSGRPLGTIDIELAVREMRDYVPPIPPPPPSSGQEEGIGGMSPGFVSLSSDYDSEATEDPYSPFSGEASGTSSQDEDGDTFMIDVTSEDDGDGGDDDDDQN